MRGFAWVQRARYLEIACLFFLAIGIGYQCFCPPILGIADNGDFARILNHFGVTQAAPSYDDRYFAYVSRLFVVDPAVRWSPLGGFLSSENGLAMAALTANKLLSKYSHYFDIRYLAAVHALLFLAAVWIGLRALANRRPAIRIATALAALAIFGDGAYLAYFNTAFTEAGLFCFYMLMLASAIAVIEGQDSDSWTYPALFIASGFCAALAKNAYFVFGFLVLLMVLRWRTAASRWQLAAASVVALLSLFYLNDVPLDMKQAYRYNMMFAQILPSSTDPDADLKALGLDPALKMYSRTYAYQEGVDIGSAYFQEKLYDRVGVGTVLHYYAMHPARGLSLIASGLDAAWFVAPLHLGSFEKSAGLPPRAQSTVWRAWSSMKAMLAPLGWIWSILLFVPTLVLNRVLYRKTEDRRIRLYCDLQLYLIAIAGLEVLFAVFSQGTIDLDRKMFVFNLITDTVIVLNGCAVIGYSSRRISKGF